MEFTTFLNELLRVSIIMRANQQILIEKEKKAVFWQPWLNSDETTAKQSTTAAKQTTKWKRDRRLRLPEYSRKSDPKIAETFGVASDQPSSPESGGSSEEQNGVSKKDSSTDSPIDMSVRQRGLPPSYSQTVNNPGYRSTYYRPSVIHNGVPSAREELPSGMSMCDPIIDEHFRRSLGSDYNALFNNNVVVPKETVKSPPVLPVKQPSPNVIELMDNTGLSVDDHFAKALGDTWAKLNKKDGELKSNGNESNLVTI